MLPVRHVAFGAGAKHQGEAEQGKKSHGYAGPA
jgi:hypothetical protein